MCGRFALTLPLTAVLEWFGARLGLVQDNAAKDLDRPRYNIRPTEQIWTVLAGPEGREVRPMRWGFLPVWCKTPNAGPPLINARSETIAEKPAFREACRATRCLIPADGFYEWRAAAGRGRDPYWIHPTNSDRLAFAGVWRRWTGPDGEPIDTVAIVTCAAQGPLADLHHRAPVQIPAQDHALWLGEEGRGAAALMRDAPEGYWGFHPVSTDINTGGRAAPDHPSLRDPVAPRDAAPPLEPDDQPKLL